MARYLCDENLGPTVVAALRTAGLEAELWSEVGDRGAPDEVVIGKATELSMVLLTRDLDFADIHAFPIGSHKGIVVCRFPNTTLPSTLGQELADFLTRIDEDLLDGNLAVLEPGGRVRFRVP